MNDQTVPPPTPQQTPFTPNTPTTPSGLQSTSFLSSIRKILTPQRIASLAIGGAGALLGSSLGPAGILAGGLGGVLLPSFLKRGGGDLILQFLGTSQKTAATTNQTSRTTYVVPTPAPDRRSSSLSFLKSPLGISLAASFGLIIIFPLFYQLSKSSAPFPPYQISEGVQELPPGGEAGSSLRGLDYFLPFRDPTVHISPQTEDEVKKQVKTRWPKALLENWDTIKTKSIANNWNLAFVLALWIEESGAQGATSYSDPLGCDPSHPTTDINVSLSCLFNNFKDYGSSRFNDFMCKYGGDGFHDAPCQFLVENPDFPTNIKNWYSQLVPSGPGAITMTEKREWLQDNFNLIFLAPTDPSVPIFNNNVYAWAAAILSHANQVAPKFKDLLKTNHPSPIEIVPICNISNSSQLGQIQIANCNGKGAMAGEIFFQQLFIHELAHKINGSRPGVLGSQLHSFVTAGGEGYLTAYSQNASPLSYEICANPDYQYNASDLLNTRIDEDFAESISYFINDQTPEQSYDCGLKWNDNLNPYAGGKRNPLHYQFISDLLKGRQ